MKGSDSTPGAAQSCEISGRELADDIVTPATPLSASREMGRDGKVRRPPEGCDTLATRGDGGLLETGAGISQEDKRSSGLGSSPGPASWGSDSWFTRFDLGDTVQGRDALFIESDSLS